MNIDVDRLGRLLAAMDEYGQGVTIRRVLKGHRQGGFGSSSVYEIDGWEIGCIDANGGDEIALEPDLNQALDKALAVVENEWGD